MLYDPKDSNSATFSEMENFNRVKEVFDFSSHCEQKASESLYDLEQKLKSSLIDLERAQEWVSFSANTIQAALDELRDYKLYQRQIIKTV